MKSGYKISWTYKAQNDLDNILVYLEENWSEKEIKSFINKLDKRLFHISKNPFLFSQSNVKKNVRRSVLTKHTVIYYSIFKNVINIITIFDPRQNPSKLKL